MSYGELDLEAIQKSNGFGRACFLPRNKKPDKDNPMDFLRQRILNSDC